MALSRQRDKKHSIKESWSGFTPDEEDLALLEHVFGDDRPPQGLHRKGHDRREAARRRREREERL